MKSSKVVVKGLGRVIGAASFNLHHEGIWRSFSSIKCPLGCEKLAAQSESCFGLVGTWRGICLIVLSFQVSLPD